MTKIAVLMTFHNRKDLTIKSLKAIENAVAGVASYDLYIVDDGSSDGTGEQISKLFPEANIIVGSGDLYWNRGMRKAWEAAIQSHPDFFLWLNDDLQLRPHSIAEMLQTYSLNVSKTIVAGRTVDPVTQAVTYGGYKITKGISRLSFRRLRDDEHECDTMNGNCVLFPFSVVQDVGINEYQYRHAFGDNDLGLRATRSGYKIVELKKPVGLQERNDAYAKKVETLTFSNAEFILRHPKGVPFTEWLLFCRRHGSFIWPANFFGRYIKMFIRGLKA